MEASPAPPQVVADLSLNHVGRTDLGKRLIDAAADAGAKAILLSLEMGHADAPKDMDRTPSPFPELGQTMAELRQRLRLGLTAVRALRVHARRRRLRFIGAPFDSRAFRLLRGINVDAWQVEPRLLADTDLVQRIAATRKPVLLGVEHLAPRSMGRTLAVLGRKRTTLLTGAGGPGSTVSDAALGRIPVLAKKWGCAVAHRCSDATLVEPIVALAMGANTIEVPLTLDRAVRAPSSEGSLDPRHLAILCQALRDVHGSIHDDGSAPKGTPALDRFLKRRGGLVARRALRAGTAIDEDMLAVREPSDGLSPGLLPTILGRRLAYDLARGRQLTFGDLEP